MTTITLAVVAISAMAIPVAATVAPLFIMISSVPAVMTIFVAAIVAVVLSKLDTRSDLRMFCSDGSSRGHSKARRCDNSSNYSSTDARKTIHGYGFPFPMFATMLFRE